MSRTRRQDCWSASVRISIPISASDPSSIVRAQEAVAKLATLIPGSSVEVTHAGFSRMAAAPDTRHVVAIQAVDAATGQVVEKIPLTGEPEIPDSLRRMVPRTA